MSEAEEGGESPAWHPSGREIFFLTPPSPAGKRRMMAVQFAPGPPPRIGRARELFTFDPRTLVLARSGVQCYDVAADGRFYGFQRVTPAPTPRITHIDLIQNWFEGLKAPPGR